MPKKIRYFNYGFTGVLSLMHMNIMSFLIKKVMRDGQILRSVWVKNVKKKFISGKAMDCMDTDVLNIYSVKIIYTYWWLVINFHRLRSRLFLYSIKDKSRLTGESALQLVLDSKSQLYYIKRKSLVSWAFFADETWYCKWNHKEFQWAEL